MAGARLSPPTPRRGGRSPESFVMLFNQQTTAHRVFLRRRTKRREGLHSAEPQTTEEFLPLDFPAGRGGWWGRKHGWAAPSGRQLPCPVSFQALAEPPIARGSWRGNCGGKALRPPAAPVRVGCLRCPPRRQCPSMRRRQTRPRRCLSRCPPPSPVSNLLGPPRVCRASHAPRGCSPVAPLIPLPGLRDQGQQTAPLGLDQKTFAPLPPCAPLSCRPAPRPILSDLLSPPRRARETVIGIPRVFLGEPRRAEALVTSICRLICCAARVLNGRSYCCPRMGAPGAPWAAGGQAAQEPCPELRSPCRQAQREALSGRQRQGGGGVTSSCASSPTQAASCTPSFAASARSPSCQAFASRQRRRGPRPP